MNKSIHGDIVNTTNETATPCITRVSSVNCKGRDKEYLKEFLKCSVTFKSLVLPAACAPAVSISQAKRSASMRQLTYSNRIGDFRDDSTEC